MRAAPLAALLLCAAPPARAGESPAGASGPVTPGVFKELSALADDFEARCRLLDDALLNLKSLRERYQDSRDPHQIDRRYKDAVRGFQASYNSAYDVRQRHHVRLESIRFVGLGRLVTAARKGKAAAGLDDRGLAEAESSVARMHSRQTRLWVSFNEEKEAFNSLAEAQETRRLRRRHVLVWAALLTAGLAWAAVLLRYGRSPSPEPARVSPGPASAPAAVPTAYSLVGLVGRGSMGEVYEAVEKTLGRRTALKRLRPELLSDPLELEGLLREARLMAGLKHPNLAAVYSVEKEAGQVYLAMEFIDGGSLQRRLDAEKRLPWPESLRIARGAGAALDYAHGRRIVHRDLKPANIMLSTKGEVKVMDFGIAHQAAKSVSRLTRAPSWGTPPYMAPEQELGGVSAAVDIYALAVCLYEMLTGELPFKGPNFLAQKREALWAPPSREAADLPAGVDGVFTIALAPEPSRRFKSAAALLAACDALKS